MKGTQIMNDFGRARLMSTDSAIPVETIARYLQELLISRGGQKRVACTCNSVVITDPQTGVYFEVYDDGKIFIGEPTA